MLMEFTHFIKWVLCIQSYVILKLINLGKQVNINNKVKQLLNDCVLCVES